MKKGIVFCALLSLIGCGGDDGGDGVDASDVPRNSTVSSNHDCDETHEVAETEPEAPIADGDSSDDDTTFEPEGCALSPICRQAVANFEAQGYLVKSATIKGGKIIIDINTCGGDASVNINSGNTSLPQNVED